MAIDLHIHSQASDGSLTPREVAKVAKELGLSTIAITDHDTVAGVDEASASGKSLGIEVVPAVEFSTEEQGEEIHILGYFLDHKALWLKERLGELKEKREERIVKISKKLAKFGIQVSPEEVKAVAGQGTLGRPHVAQVMAMKGYVTSTAEAFHRYLGNTAPAYVPREHVSPAEAIEIVIKAEGIPVLAHPVLIKDQNRIFGLLELGLAGLECWHSEQGGSVAARYVKFAKAHDLAITGGSDYHGPYLNGTRALGKPQVSDDVYVQLVRFRDSRKNR